MRNELRSECDEESIGHNSNFGNNIENTEPGTCRTERIIKQPVAGKLITLVSMLTNILDRCSINS